MKQAKLLTLFMLLLVLTPIINADYRDPFFEISKGNVPGHSVIHKFGHNEALSVSFETIWSGSNIYTYPAAATLMNLTSTDVNDDNGDTGAWNVTVYGLDANYNMINETIILDGQNPVSSTLQYLRVYRLVVRSSGTSTFNEGIIYLGTGATVGGVPTNIYAIIDANYGITYMTQFTVPSGYTGYIKTIRGTCYTTNKNFEVYLRTRPIGESWLRREEWHLSSGGQLPPDGGLPYRVEAMTDIEFIGAVDVAGGITEISYDLVLVQDGYEFIEDIEQSTNNILLYLIIILAVVMLLAYGRK